VVQAWSGTLSLDGGGASSGLFQVAGNCTNNFGGLTHTVLAGARFEGAGLVKISVNYSGPVLSIAAPLTITNRFELAAQAALGGTNTVTFTGPFDWVGGTMSDVGKTVFASSAVVTVSGAPSKFLRQRTVDNYATATFNSGLLVDIGAIWNNYGTLVLTGDYNWAYGGAGGSGIVNNFGLFKKTAGAGYADMQVHVRNATGSSTVRSEAGLLIFSVSFVQTNGLTELAGGHLAGTLLDLRGGVLTGSGNIAANVLNNATVMPGQGIGQITISNSIAQTYSGPTGTLVFQVGGLAPITGHDRLRIHNGTATLGGTLRAELANGYVPTAGNTYTVMTFTARSGVFTNFVFPDYQFGVVQTATNVILVASNALPTVQMSGTPSNQLVCVPFRMRVSAADLDGTITNLSVLFGTNVVATYPNGNPRTLEFDYDYPGTYVFTTRAYDNRGAMRETNVTTTYYTMPLHVLNLGGKVAVESFKFCMLGEAGTNYVVLASTNANHALSEWTVLGLMEQTNGIWRYIDSGTVSNRVMRYYRAVRVP
jgi:hypothetical protein